MLQADNINTLTKAAGIEVEPYWPGLFAKLVEKKSIDDFIVNVGAGERRSSRAGGLELGGTGRRRRRSGCCCHRLGARSCLQMMLCSGELQTKPAAEMLVWVLVSISHQVTSQIH